MRRTLSVLLLFVAVPFVHADARPGDPIQLVVSPAAAPKPSLKYRLIPDRRDLTPGNAATLYYRAMASFVENSQLLKEIKEPYWSEWMETPVKDLPMAQVGEKLRYASRLLHEIELGSRCKDCDWQIEDRAEGIGLVLPEVQSFRYVAVVLAVRARYEIAQGKWDDAAQTLQVGYAVGRHMGRGPTFIQIYVGGAIAPGLELGLEALAARTAKLPRIELRAPDRAIGRDTVSAMQSGTIFGYQALVTGLLARIRRELADTHDVEPDAVCAILTGGLSAAPWARGRAAQPVGAVFRAAYRLVR